MNLVSTRSREEWVEQLFRQHHSALCRYLARMMRCEEAAAEVAQETYLRLLRFASRSPVTNPRAYLFQVASNVARSRLAKESNPTVVFLDPATTAEISSPASSVEQIASVQQELDMLARAIEELPPRCRQVFRMNRFQGMSYSEISRELKISVNMVEKHIIKALLKCRKYLKQDL
ncbi:MAG: RNA polymerase sigma factor [Candidatus Nitronauta litoralis]|uniref:RNA polymerase sigma factor n=1 Tax=Candidatus Nitronauta litoralis TaxID=2705533 RepID=A0A7T0BYA7_9BACT|nr:MAG: RNA polymerase sigma factor [Candidatus Nitronauta litoralis]